MYPNRDGTAVIAVDRRKLYDQLWSIPASRLAILYGISDVGLAKVCKRYRIPRPPRGYWAKLKAGKPVGKPVLPRVTGEEYTTVYMKGWDMPDEAVQQNVACARDTTPHDTNMSKLPPELHPLAALAGNQLAAAQPDRNGLVRTEPATAISLCVSPASVERCLSIVSAFIQKWESCGGEVRIVANGPQAKPATAVAIGPDEFFIRLFEVVDESKALSEAKRLTGNLTLMVEGDENRQFRRRWSDTKSQRLERMITPLISTLSRALETKKADRLDKECEQRQKQRVEERCKAAARKSDRDFRWRQQLMENVNRWHDADRIRAYLRALQGSIESGEVRPIDEASFKEWFDWAVCYADSIDPIVQAQPRDQPPANAENKPVSELDLTSHTREALGRLEVTDAEALHHLGEDEVREANEGSLGPVWNEITRVLEGLGYDVSKRRQATYC